MSADQVNAWAAVEAKGAEAAAADVAAMVMGQPRSVITRMLTSMFERSIRMRQGLEAIAGDTPHTESQARAIARRALGQE